MRYPITFEAAVRSAVWLDRRRFFLAASGNSAVIDLARTADAGQREEWIPTPVHFPAHVLLVGADSVLTASSDGSGNRVAVHRTDLTTRDSEPLAEARLGEVFGLAQRPGTGPLIGRRPFGFVSESGQRLSTVSDSTLAIDTVEMLTRTDNALAACQDLLVSHASTWGLAYPLPLREADLSRVDLQHTEATSSWQHQGTSSYQQVHTR
ncbi:hypothetical protein [Streptomyces europaeiscabiei]|uniref:hypothetical protein n=1 Tax=Streptomyces europaeiscabiei TaxID=146819 RepID=UPI002E29917A|nr:hypothetical protein [Streptomyces europaeiscabiei]